MAAATTEQASLRTIIKDAYEVGKPTRELAEAALGMLSGEQRETLVLRALEDEFLDYEAMSECGQLIRQAEALFRRRGTAGITQRGLQRALRLPNAAAAARLAALLVERGVLQRKPPPNRRHMPGQPPGPAYEVVT